MWTAFILLYLWLLCFAVSFSSVSSSPPLPINIVFSSVNLKNVLHWSPGNGTTDDIHFTVQYAIYGDSVGDSKRVHWRKVRQCMKTVRNWCDLSNQTWDLEQGYYARVRAVDRRASSKWALTQWRFDPQLDTSFGPPLVSVEIEDNSAIITLKGPMRYQPDNHTPVISMAMFYPQMTYNLSIHNMRRDQIHLFIVDSSPYTYRMMDYETEYCFSAKARFLVMPIQCHSSEWHCITTPQDPVIGQLQRVIVGIVVPLLFLCALLVICYFLCNYLTGKGQKSPYILNPPSFHPPPLTFTNAENPNIIIITIEPSSLTEPTCPLGHDLHFPELPPRYSPERAVTPSEPVEAWDDVSLDYGHVGLAPKVDVVRKEEEGGGDRTELKDKCGAGSSYEKEAWMVADGQSTGFYAPQVKPRLPLRSTAIFAHTCAHACTCSQVNSALLTQAQVDREKEDREHSALFRNKTLQTGLPHVPFNPQTNKEVGTVKVTDAKLDGDSAEGSGDEKIALLSANASQYTPPFHTEQSHILANDYGILSPATEEGADVYSEEEEGTVSINWDPESRRLVVPEVNMEFNKQRGVDGPEQEGKGKEDTLRLENVFVRQSSEEEREAAALREMGTGGAAGCEMDEFVSKWKLVIPVDQ